MKFLQRIKTTFRGFGTGFLRFPIPLLLAYVTAGILLVLNSERNLDQPVEDTLVRIMMACCMGIPLFLGIGLAFERTSLSFAARIAIMLFSGIAIAGYGVFLLPEFKMVTMTRYFLLTGALVLLFLTVPFFLRRQGFALYATRLIIRLLITALYSLILMLSLFAILFTLDKLLGVHITENTYVYTAIIVWAAFAPTLFVSYIPPEGEEPDLSNSPLTLRILMIYIQIPLISVYALILYAYSARILINMAWPKGLVTNLVLGFATVGILLMFLVLPVKSGNRIAEIFTGWYPRVSLPLFITLFAALGIRLAEYGFTEPRYFAFVLALWCFGAMLYYTFSKRKFLTVLPVSLSIVAVLSAFGPASAFSVSEYSQERRFEAILASNGMLREGHAVPASKPISKRDRSDLASIIQYFERYHKLAMLDSLPAGFTPDRTKSVLGFDYNESSQYSQTEYASYYIDPYEKSYPISGYDYMLPMQDGAIGVINPGNHKVGCKMENLFLEIDLDGKKAFSKDLSETLKALHERYPTDGGKIVPMEELTIDGASAELDIRLILTNLNGSLDRGDLPDPKRDGFAEGFILLKWIGP